MPNPDADTITDLVRGSRGAHVVLLCGTTGSGKTTLGRRLEHTLPAVRFNVDDWMIALFGQHMPRAVFDERFALIQGRLWDVAERLLALGVHVVLDYGFWRRGERIAAARKARAAGATPLLVYLDAPGPVLEQRLARRNADLPTGTYEITRDMLSTFAAHLEPPQSDEGLRLITIRAGNDEVATP